MVNLPYITRVLVWIGDSKEVLSSFPLSAKQVLGFGLRQVQNGETPDIAKPLKNLGDGVFELKVQTSGEADRVVYIAKLKDNIYVLDAFHKKSKKGKAMPREIIERIKKRLKFAKQE